MESAEPPPGAVPWRCLIVEPGGKRSLAFRLSRPSASATDIADEVMAVVAHKIYRTHDRDKKTAAKLLAECKVQVTRPEYDGWPAQYGESRGATWLDDAHRPVPEDQAT